MQDLYVRSTGLEPVPVAGHAPQTCAYADSATTADEQQNYNSSGLLCQDKLKTPLMIYASFHYKFIDSSTNC